MSLDAPKSLFLVFSANKKKSASDLMGFFFLVSTDEIYTFKPRSRGVSLHTYHSAVKLQHSAAGTRWKRWGSFEASAHFHKVCTHIWSRALYGSGNKATSNWAESWRSSRECFCPVRGTIHILGRLAYICGAFFEVGAWFELCALPSWQVGPCWRWECGRWWTRATTSACSTPTCTRPPPTSW